VTPLDFLRGVPQTDHDFNAAMAPVKKASYAAAMTRWTPLLVLLAATMLSGQAHAADTIIARQITSTEDGATSSAISFAYASCEEECHVATLSCSESGAISFVFADVDARNAAKAITAETKQVILAVGAKSFDYFIQEMQYAEMTGSWWLTTHTLDEHARDLAPAIATAKSIEAETGGQKIVLPVDKAVKAWAAACK
jgi:hypothetical protein